MDKSFTETCCSYCPPTGVNQAGMLMSVFLIANILFNIILYHKNTQRTLICRKKSTISKGRGIHHSLK